MKPEITIRTGTVADRDIIADFNRRMANETEGKALSSDVLERGVARALSEPALAQYFLACRADGSVVGQLMVTTEWSDWRNGQIWWIQSVYVTPEARQCGVYRALHEHVRQLACQAPSVVGIRLYVERENERAQRVYSRVGMVDASYIVYEQMFDR